MGIRLATVLLLVIICNVLGAQSTNEDFDFYYGSWHVENNRQLDDGRWAEFPAKVVATKALNGNGNIDVFEATINGEYYSGMSVRIYDAINKHWQVEWYDTDSISLNPTPSIGKFENGEGKFYKTIETTNGTKVKVRFLWSNINYDTFSWEASWSIDMENWTPTWIMNFKRIK